jgi:hypothetical protein
MIGCTRQVKEITLGIHCIGADSEELCVVWGSPAYSYENDFRDEKTEDVLTVSFYLRSEKFDSLYDLVRGNQLDWINLRLTDVEGFYSEWSPSISTDCIKVLVNIADQRLELDEEWSKKIPTLGKVGQASLSFQRTLHSQNIPNKAEENVREISEENGAYDEVSADLERETVADRASVEDSRYKLLERSLSRISKLLGVLILVEILRAIF